MADNSISHVMWTPSSRVCRSEATKEMAVGPPKPVTKNWFQTTTSGYRKKRWSWALCSHWSAQKQKYWFIKDRANILKML